MCHTTTAMRKMRKKKGKPVKTWQQTSKPKLEETNVKCSNVLATASHLSLEYGTHP